MRPARAILIALALSALTMASVGCLPPQTHSVWIRNDTALSYTIFLEYGSASNGYGSAVTPNEAMFANTPGAGAHPSSFTVYDEACQRLGGGAIRWDDAEIDITADGITVGEATSVPTGAQGQFGPATCPSG
jgi:hypothetical protein